MLTIRTSRSTHRTSYPAGGDKFFRSPKYILSLVRCFVPTDIPVHDFSGFTAPRETCLPAEMLSPSSKWAVRRTRRNGRVMEIAYGRDKHFPQVAALHLDSSYLRLNCGPGSTWGTSVILLPVVWEAGKAGPTQGGRIRVTASRTPGGELLCGFFGAIAGLDVEGSLRFYPPDANGFCVDVRVCVNGKAVLNLDYADEAFKTVMLSSMYLDDDCWDTDRAYVGAAAFALPAYDAWIVPTPQTNDTLGLRGGVSKWQEGLPAPTIDILSPCPMRISGWISRPDAGAGGGPNSDNVALWASESHVRPAWEYRITARL